MFDALVLTESDGTITPALQSLDDDALPAGDVTVAVEYSSLNYKDALIIRNKARLVRNFPHVPGIDLAGTVIASDAAAFSPGDRVICTGWRVGEAHWGGFSQRARLRSEWLVPCPDGLSTRDAMALGTAGLTAAMAVEALEAHGMAPDAGPVLVTGAAGGLGSVAVYLLARTGRQVTASTGRAETHPYLKGLGATDVIERAEIAEAPGRPLLSERWAGSIDNVGGATLAHVLAELRLGASVASCGNTGGNDYPGSVIPFLLRGVNVLGIDSVTYPNERRTVAWQRLAELCDRAFLDEISTEVALSDVIPLADEILEGRIRGRVVIALSGQ
jgi:acrylyl-CoA reductase (NADPH)